MMNYKQLIVVEGLHDKIKLKEVFPNIATISTNGSEISEHTIKLIKKASESFEIVLFLDPDFPGERIRNKLLSIVPNAKHAFISKDKCVSHNKKKVGVEHASKESIINALDKLLTPRIKTNDEIDLAFLVSIKLIGHKDSSKLRKEVSDHFNIGKPNGKALLKRINMFGITKEELLNFLKK